MQMHEDAKAIGMRRAISVAAVRREIRRIVDRHDDDVRKIVNDEQWKLYDDFKSGLVEQIEKRIDTVRLQQ